MTVTATLRVGADQWEAVRSDLLSTPDLERAAIGFAGIVGTGSVGKLLLRDWAPVPPGEYDVQLGYHLEVNPVFWARAAKRARESGEALVIMHSHPRDPHPPRFSPSDDGGEDRLVPRIHARATVPVGAVVISPGGEEARVTRAGDRRAEMRVEVVGREQHVTTASPRSLRYDRQARALGADGHALLERLKVGVVGAGGLGSHVVQQLVHLGVGTVVVVDPDSVAESNLSRLVGASRFDASLRRHKTRVARRLARRAGSTTEVVEVRQSVTHAAGAEPLLTCDYIMGCTDNHWSRTVLNAFAFQYFIPVMDLGVELQRTGASGGRVTWLAPGSSCLWCLGILDPERVRIEQLPEVVYKEEIARGYIEGLDEPAPAVVSINGVVASLAVTELLARVTEFAGDTKRPDLLMYRLRDGVVRRTGAARSGRCPTCSPHGLLGAGELSPPPWLSS